MRTEPALRHHSDTGKRQGEPRRRSGRRADELPAHAVTATGRWAVLRFGRKTTRAARTAPPAHAAANVRTVQSLHI